VQVTETRADWSRVVCSNGWSAWVDGRQLQVLGASLSGMFSSPAVTITATLHGMGLVGWKVEFDVRNEAGDKVGAGAGLGKGGQVWREGYALTDQTGSAVLTVEPTKQEWIVSDGLQQPVGTIVLVSHGIKGTLKPVYELRSGVNPVGHVSSEEVGGRKWAVTDPLQRNVATIRDVTLMGRMMRHGMCTTKVTIDVDPPLRTLLIAATANTALERMRFYNRPRNRA